MNHHFRSGRRTRARQPFYIALSCWIVSSALGLLSAASYGAEQDTSGVIDEIIVTGTKREQSSQDVPIALTAISDEALKKQFRTDILAVGELSPGVALGQVAGFRAIAGGIRGTGQNSILVTQDSSVVLLVDEFGLNNVQAQFVELFDVDRVEVYRGPQGTLFGKSATGGAISIITKRPEMNEFYADVEVQLGYFDGDDGPDRADISKYRAAINVPLIEDKLSFRGMAIWDEDDGYYTNNKNTGNPNNGLIPNAFGGAPLPDILNSPTNGTGENLNNTDVFASKMKLLWQPTENYEAYFIWSHLEDRSGSPPGVNESEPTMLLPLLGFPSVQAAGERDILNTGITNQCYDGNEEGLCVSAGHRVDVDLFQLHQSLKFEDMQLQLILGKQDMEEILPSTYTGESYQSLFDASRNTTRDQRQAELRLSSDFAGPFNFVVGASWADEETDMLAYSTVGLSGLLTFVDPDRNDGLPGPFFNGDGTLALETDFQTDPAMGGAAQDRETTAFYGDFTWDATERLTLTAGIRYTKDEKDFFRRANPGGPCTALTPAKDQQLINGECLDARSNAVSRVGVGFEPRDLQAFNIPLPDSAFGIASRTDDEWDETTYRFVANWSLNDSSMIYASYATGFISGGFTETCSSIATCQPFEAETNQNLEFGFKGQFLDNRLQANFAVFFTEYEDLIRSQVVPFTNAFGITTQETINVNAGVSEAQGFEAEVTWLATPNLQVDFNLGYLDHEYDEFDLNGQDLSGNEVPFSPELKWGVSVTYDHELGNYGTVTWNTNFNHQDELEMSVFNSPLTQMSERDLWDANVTFRDAQERYYVTLWSKNLLDERYRIAANSVAGLWNFTMYGRPRSYGLEFGVSFN
ncbi:MAG: TonB-dependent receptor [Pseudomonadales bacterium]